MQQDFLTALIITHHLQDVHSPIGYIKVDTVKEKQVFRDAFEWFLPNLRSLK